MSNNDGQLAINITAAPNQTAAIRLLRAATGLPLSKIKSALNNQTSLAVAKLYGIDHAQNEHVTKSLFAELDSAGIEFDLILDGVKESRQQFYNTMQQWYEIVLETQMLADLEIGEPGVETLEWLRATVSADVFQATIRQIIDGKDFKVDDETLEWAKSIRSDA